MKCGEPTKEITAKQYGRYQVFGDRFKMAEGVVPLICYNSSMLLRMGVGKVFE
jgi:hypothetical protein